jgi:hypothetical protein
LAVVVAAQLLIPGAALVQPAPTRFGFQMYSGQGSLAIDVVDGAGHALEVDLIEYIAAPPRLELDWTRNLPEYLCTVVPAAARVTVTQPNQSRAMTC